MQNDVRFDVVGEVGHITLTRPRKLNALTWHMVHEITRVLVEWENVDTVTSVLINAEEDTSFCAGGDIESTYAWTFGKQASAHEYWRDEHKLVLLIASYKKPVVTLLDGFVLGGGVGLACHASHRLVTPIAKVGMPEVAIGLAPDVGGLYILGHAPDRLGFYLALTAQYTGPLGALSCGFADKLVRKNCRAELVEALADGEEVDRAVTAIAVEAGDVDLQPEDFWYARNLLKSCFGGLRMEEILASLDSREEPIAAKTAKRIRAMSPLAVKVTLRGLMHVVNGTTFQETLMEDLRRNVHFSYGHDLREGIRATVIDKDRHPIWSPRSLAEVSDEMVMGYFQPIKSPDLDTDAVLQRVF